MRQKPGCNTFPSSAVSLMTAQPEIHKLWLAQTKKNPAKWAGLSGKHPGRKLPRSSVLETCRRRLSNQKTSAPCTNVVQIGAASVLPR